MRSSSNDERSTEFPVDDAVVVTGGAAVTPEELFRRHTEYELRRSLSDAATTAEVRGHPAGERAENTASPVSTRIVDFKRRQPPDDIKAKLAERQSEVASFNPLQEWDGYVIEIGVDSFRARITDLTNEGDQDGEEVEISLAELDDDSRSLIEPGRLFRWSIGYQRSRAGQKTRVSRIIVRRLPAWRPEDLETARREAREISQHIKIE